MARCNIDIIVTLKEPAIFAAGHEAGNLISTRDYIPGNVILGAFVERFLYELGRSDTEPDFKQFFLSDAVRFENLYPAGGKLERSRTTTPIPLSTFTCKDYEGLNKKGFTGDEHPYSDFLVGEMTPECQKTISSSQICDAPLKNREGFYFTEDGRYDFRVQPAKVIRMHNVIEDAAQRPTEEVGGVFSFEALEEGQFFRGFVSFCNETLRDKFKNLLFGEEEEIDLYLGRARRRGYGEAKLRVLCDFQSPDDIPASLLKGKFNSRWTAFQAKKPGHFSITLHSDAIVADKFLRYHTTLTKSLLAAELRVPAEALKRQEVFSRHMTVDGFSGIHKLPLESEVAIAKGSAFLFMIEKNDFLTNIKEGLQRLEQESIGFRRNEGFGRLIVCDNYHLRCSKLETREGIDD